VLAAAMALELELGNGKRLKIERGPAAFAVGDK